jgi:hypothetical protein
VEHPERERVLEWASLLAQSEGREPVQGGRGAVEIDEALEDAYQSLFGGQLTTIAITLGAVLEAHA